VRRRRPQIYATMFNGSPGIAADLHVCKPGGIFLASGVETHKVDRCAPKSPPPPKSNGIGTPRRSASYGRGFPQLHNSKSVQV
jgi:hypothetical protein